MGGSPVRVKLLNIVAGSARNSLQLANELDIDWKTIDNHIEILTRYGLVEEKMVVRNAKYYIVTEH
jgi:predicted transcriptional regulator